MTDKEWNILRKTALSEDEREAFKKAAGYRLGNLREQAGIEGKELANFWGCSTSKVSRIENGATEIGLDALLVYRDVLGLSFDALLDVNETLPKEQVKRLGRMPMSYRKLAITTLNAIWDTYRKENEKKAPKHDHPVMGFITSGSFFPTASDSTYNKFESYGNRDRFILIDQEEMETEENPKIRKVLKELFALYEEEGRTL